MTSVLAHDVRADSGQTLSRHDTRSARVTTDEELDRLWKDIFEQGHAVISDARHAAAESRERQRDQSADAGLSHLKTGGGRLGAGGAMRATSAQGFRLFISAHDLAACGARFDPSACNPSVPCAS